MKAQLLILIAIVMIASACQVNKELLTLDNTSIKIKDVKVINSDKGEVICYTINLYAPSSLSEFVAEPNIAGENDDSVTRFQFDNHARRATVIYYYVMPKGKKFEEIKISFRLNEATLNVNDVKYASAF